MKAIQDFLSFRKLRKSIWPVVNQTIWGFAEAAPAIPYWENYR